MFSLRSTTNSCTEASRNSWVETTWASISVKTDVKRLLRKSITATRNTALLLLVTRRFLAIGLEMICNMNSVLKGWQKMLQTDETRNLEVFQLRNRKSSRDRKISMLGQLDSLHPIPSITSELTHRPHDLFQYRSPSFPRHKPIYFFISEHILSQSPSNHASLGIRSPNVKRLEPL